MRLTRSAALVTLAGLVAAPLTLGAVRGESGSARPAGSLAVRQAGRWIVWWTSARAPAAWDGPLDLLERAIPWKLTRSGVSWGEARVAGDGEARRVRIIAVRLDPSRVRFRLDTAWRADGRPGWTVDRTGHAALVALNTGQFPRTLPWGWLVLGGRELMPPGRGSLTAGLAFDSAGALRWLSAAELAVPASRRGVMEGFQSYPRLLDGGRVPAELRAAGAGVDLRHRDARLAIGQTTTGTILIVLTRFDGMGGMLDFVPFGLTTPEMAAVMGALGARDAVLLDGGISSQLLIRDGEGVHRWRGLREVPVGLVVTAR